MWYGLSRMVREEVIPQFLSMFQLNPFPLKQWKVHFIGFPGFLHHPQPHYNNFCLTLHKRNHKPSKEYLLQDNDLEVLMKKQNHHSSAKLQ
jgi:hypothetical protein